MQRVLSSLIIIYICLLVGVGFPQVKVWMIDKEIEKIRLSNQDFKNNIGDLQKEYEYLIDVNRLFQEATGRESLQMRELTDEQQVEVYYYEFKK